MLKAMISGWAIATIFNLIMVPSKPLPTPVQAPYPNESFEESVESDVDNLRFLFNQWIHAYEEDEGDILTYRPSTDTFPPARGRTGFTFEANGRFVQQDIAPACGYEYDEGRWQQLPDGQIVLELPGRSPATLDIISLEADRLRVRLH